MRYLGIFGFCVALVGLGSGASAQDATVTVAVEAEAAPPQPVVQPAPVAPVQQQPVAVQPAPVPVQTMQPLPQAPQLYPGAMPVLERRKNSIFIEGLGAGLLWSVNFERLIIPDLAIRLGFGAFTLAAFGGGLSSRVFVATVPVSVSYLGLGSNRHMFEVGGGATLIIESAAVSGIRSSSSSGASVYGTVFAGYRLHPVGRAGFLFRAGIMGMIARGFNLSSTAGPDDFGILPWPYISGGMSF